MHLSIHKYQAPARRDSAWPAAAAEHKLNNLAANHDYKKRNLYLELVGMHQRSKLVLGFEKDAQALSIFVSGRIMRTCFAKQA
jgi:hypothetical protein